MSNQHWLPIMGYEQQYSVSADGEVRREPQGRLLCPSVNRRNGYLYVSLSAHGKARNFRLHVLVARAFLGPSPEGKVVNHMDGVKAHNNIANLEYVTPSENSLHAYRLGLLTPPPVRLGTQAFTAKLSEADVLAIRQSPESNRKLGVRFGVDQSTIGDVKRGRTWQAV